MHKSILLASQNPGKAQRFRRLLALRGLDIAIRVPQDFKLAHIDPAETGATLEENAEIKAQSFFGLVDLPVLANDTGFWVEGEGLVNAPKRLALGQGGPARLTREEIARAMVNFWKGVASRHGGRVNAAWVEAFVLLLPDGTKKTATCRREVVLTDTEYGRAGADFPLRGLYIAKSSGKPVLDHTEAEEIEFLEPVSQALASLLNA